MSITQFSFFCLWSRNSNIVVLLVIFSPLCLLRGTSHVSEGYEGTPAPLPPLALASSRPVKVLLVGDSITACMGPQKEHPRGYAGYRRRIWERLYNHRPHLSDNGPGAAATAAATESGALSRPPSTFHECAEFVGSMKSFKKEFGIPKNMCREVSHAYGYDNLTDVVPYEAWWGRTTTTALKYVVPRYSRSGSGSSSSSRMNHDGHRRKKKSSGGNSDRTDRSLAVDVVFILMGVNDFMLAGRPVYDVLLSLRDLVGGFSSADNSSSTSVILGTILTQDYEKALKDKPQDPSWQKMKGKVTATNRVLRSFASNNDRGNADKGGEGRPRKEESSSPLTPMKPGRFPKSDALLKQLAQEALQTNTSTSLLRSFSSSSPSSFYSFSLLDVTQNFNPVTMTFDAVHPNILGEDYLGDSIFEGALAPEILRKSLIEKCRRGSSSYIELGRSTKEETIPEVVESDPLRPLSRGDSLVHHPPLTFERADDTLTTVSSDGNNSRDRSLITSPLIFLAVFLLPAPWVISRLLWKKR